MERDFLREQNLEILRSYIKDENLRLANPRDIFSKFDNKNIEEFINFVFSLKEENEPNVVIISTIQLYFKYLSVKNIDINNKLIILACYYISRNLYVEKALDRLVSKENNKYVIKREYKDVTKEMILDILKTLGWKVMDPNIYDYLSIIENISDIPRFSTYTDYGVFEQFYSTLILSIDFICLPVSLQLTTIFRLLNISFPEMEIILQKTKEQIDTCYYIVKTFIRDNYALDKIMKKSFDKEFVFEADIEEIMDKLTRTYIKEEEINVIPISTLEYSKKYTNIMQIGDGSFGIISEVENNITKTRYAEKSLLKDNENSVDEFIKSIICEISSFLYFNEVQGLLRIHNIFNVDENIKIIMKLYKNTLDNEIKKRGNNICGYLRKVIKGAFIGLKNLHSRGFSHADIHSGNILIDENNESVLADFSITKRFQKSIPFFSQFKYLRGGSPLTYSIDWKEDVYSLGYTILLLFIDDFDKFYMRPDQYKDRVQKILILLLALLDKVKIKSKLLFDLLLHMLCKEDDRWCVGKLLNHDYFKEVEDVVNEEESLLNYNFIYPDANFVTYNTYLAYFVMNKST